MSLWRLVVREMMFRKWNGLLGLLAVMVSVAAVAGTMTLYDLHEEETRSLLDARETEVIKRMTSLQDVVRNAVDSLGFNVTLLPAGQDLGDWYSQEYGETHMPQDYVKRLKNANLRTLTQPVGQLRKKLKWREKKWTVILVGTEGRILRETRQAQFYSLSRGNVWLGHEIHGGLGLSVGQTVKIKKREFLVERCVMEEGNKNDITIWMSLADAQELLREEGLISEIVAVETRDGLANPGAVKTELSRMLPDVQVVEELSKSVSALRARLGAETKARDTIDLERRTQFRLLREKRRLAVALNGIVFLLCAAWIGLLAFSNVAERKAEVGVWRALGVPSRKLTFLFAARWLTLAVLGGILGMLAGIWLGGRIGPGEGTAGMYGMDFVMKKIVDMELLGTGLGLIAALTLVAVWIPVHVSSRQDPATVMQDG